jgi:hypothetical protein
MQRSPFTAVRWKDTTPEVQLGGTWYELRQLDEQPTAQLVSFAQKTYGKIWQKRLDEDLDDVLNKMGHPAGDTVTLRLRMLDAQTEIQLKVPMTHENRQAVWTFRNQPPATQGAR